MLVLSRKHNEKVVLPTVDVEITVVEIQGDRVRLGIKAPKELPVHRDEVWLRIQAQEQARSGDSTRLALEAGLA